jgi:hypothetical protein
MDWFKYLVMLLAIVAAMVTIVQLVPFIGNNSWHYESSVKTTTEGR